MYDPGPSAEELQASYEIGKGLTRYDAEEVRKLKRHIIILEGQVRGYRTQLTGQQRKKRIRAKRRR